MRKVIIVIIVVLSIFVIINMIDKQDVSTSSANNDLMQVDSINRVKSAIDIVVDEQFVFAISDSAVADYTTLSNSGKVVITGDINKVTSVAVSGDDQEYQEITPDQIDGQLIIDTSKVEYVKIDISEQANLTISAM